MYPLQSLAYFYLKTTVGLTPEELERITMSHGTVLGLSVDDNIAPKLEWLRGTLGLDAADLRGLVARQPSLLHLSVDANLAPTVAWFTDSPRGPRLTPSELRKLVLALPAALCYSTRDNLEPKFAFLARDLGMSVADLRTVTVKNPSVLAASLRRYVPLCCGGAATPLALYRLAPPRPAPPSTPCAHPPTPRPATSPRRRWRSWSSG